jgi:hypothetical protein
MIDELHRGKIKHLIPPILTYVRLRAMCTVVFYPPLQYLEIRLLPALRVY